MYKEIKQDKYYYKMEYYCSDSNIIEGYFLLTCSDIKTDDYNNIYYELSYVWNETKIIESADSEAGLQKPLIEETGEIVTYAVYSDGQIRILGSSLS